jgi:hypothetical protein
LSTHHPDWGVIEYQHRIVCWFLVDEWGSVTEPYVEGGTLTRQAPTGRKIFEARVLGSEQLLEITPELQAAIDADLRRVK